MLISEEKNKCIWRERKDENINRSIISKLMAIITILETRFRHICIIVYNTNNMDNNKSIQSVDNSKNDMSGKLTRREIFEEVRWITESLRDNSFMGRLDDSITSICSAEDVDSDAIRAMVESVCDVYKMRTSTLEKSLSLYQQMLYDVSDDD